MCNGEESQSGFLSWGQQEYSQTRLMQVQMGPSLLGSSQQARRKPTWILGALGWWEESQATLWRPQALGVWASSFYGNKGQRIRRVGEAQIVHMPWKDR